MTVPVLETARLLLRPLELADAAQVQIIFPHWDVVKHLNALVPWPYPPDGAQRYYEDVALPAMGRGDEWTWMLRLNAASRRISERSGMRIVATIERDFVSGRLPAEIWEISAEEWNARPR